MSSSDLLLFIAVGAPLLTVAGLAGALLGAVIVRFCERAAALHHVCPDCGDWYTAPPGIRAPRCPACDDRRCPCAVCGGPLPPSPAVALCDDCANDIRVQPTDAPL